jgi:hypothetical protein
MYGAAIEARSFVAALLGMTANGGWMTVVDFAAAHCAGAFGR